MHFYCFDVSITQSLQGFFYFQLKNEMLGCLVWVFGFCFVLFFDSSLAALTNYFSCEDMKQIIQCHLVLPVPMLAKWSGDFCMWEQGP